MARFPSGLQGATRACDCFAHDVRYCNINLGYVDALANRLSNFLARFKIGETMLTVGGANDLFLCGGERRSAFKRVSRLGTGLSPTRLSLFIFS